MTCQELFSHCINNSDILLQTILHYFIHLQVALLEESWADLFVISLAQWKLPLNYLPMLTKSMNSPLTLDLIKINNLTSKIDLHRLDSTEYACLKALAVFKPGECKLKISITFL